MNSKQYSMAMMMVMKMIPDCHCWKSASATKGLILECSDCLWLYRLGSLPENYQYQGS